MLVIDIDFWYSVKRKLDPASWCWRCVRHFFKLYLQWRICFHSNRLWWNFSLIFQIIVCRLIYDSQLHSESFCSLRLFLCPTIWWSQPYSLYFILVFAFIFARLSMIYRLQSNIKAYRLNNAYRSKKNLCNSSSYISIYTSMYEIFSHSISQSLTLHFTPYLSFHTF